MALIEAEPAPKKSGSLVVTLAAVAGLSLVAAGGGWYLGSMLGPQKSAAEKAAATHIEHDQRKEAEAEQKEKISTAANGVVDLEPMTTNLAYPSDTWVRLEVSLLFRGEPDVKMAETIHQDLLAYLRTVSLQQISGPRGFQNLRQDLEARAELRSKGAVRKLMVRTFVIE
ncbi:MAG: flagellar basal body-associated FliL family protein [Pararhizobium sp.]